MGGAGLWDGQRWGGTHGRFPLQRDSSLRPIGLLRALLCCQTRGRVGSRQSAAHRCATLLPRLPGAYDSPDFELPISLTSLVRTGLAVRDDPHSRSWSRRGLPRRLRPDRARRAAVQRRRNDAAPSLLGLRSFVHHRESACEFGMKDLRASAQRAIQGKD